MDFKEMEYVLAIIEEGTLSRAAEKMYITQPSLSRIVIKIEKHLGMPLFDRTKSPWELTYIGKLFAQKSEAILKIEKSFLYDVDDVLNVKKGMLTIGITSFEEHYLVSKVFPVFHEKHQDIQINFSASYTAGLEKLILNNDVDIAIIPLPIKCAEIEYIPIKTYKLLLAIPPNHKLARGYKHAERVEDYPTIDLALLKDEPFIISKADGSTRSSIIAVCQSFGFSPKIALELHNFDISHNFVIAGYGSAFILDEVIKYFKPLNKAAYFKIQGYNLEQTIAFAYKKGRKLNEIEKSFLKILRENQ